jgi:hypothetical protein
MSRTFRTPTAPPRRRDQRRPAAARPVPPPLWFADRLLSVLTGTKPLACLAGYLPPATYDQVWHLMNANPAWPTWASISRPAVRRYQVMPVALGILEVTAVVTLAPTAVRAIAFRLEHTENGHPPLSPHSWRCTAVEAP